MVGRTVLRWLRRVFGALLCFPSSKSLPRGWEEAKGIGGRTYYIDHNTRTTTWLHPRTQLPAKTKLDPSMPVGWEEVTTEKGQTYFKNHIDGYTTWRDPRHDPSVLHASVNDFKDNPLPSGWEPRHSLSGKIYFIDHNTRTTTWDDPRVHKYQLSSTTTSSSSSSTSI